MWAWFLTSLWVMIITSVAIMAPGMDFKRKYPINYVLCAVYTLSTTYMISARAIESVASVGLSIGLSLALVLLILGVLGGCITLQKGSIRKEKALEISFSKLGFIFILSSFIFYTFPTENKRDIDFRYLYVVAMLMGYGFFMADTLVIASGNYGNIISKDDYVYAASKLFSDFALCLVVIIGLGDAFYP